jgi:hypothetical protein
LNRQKNCSSARKRSGGIFDIERKLIEVEEEEQKTHDPKFGTIRKLLRLNSRKYLALKNGPMPIKR